MALVSWTGNSILVPFINQRLIVLLSFVGAYSISMSVFNLYVMLIVRRLCAN